MDHAHCMRRIQDAHYWFENLESLGWSEPPVFFEFSIKRLAIDVFHDHVNRAVACRSQVVNRNGVGVPQASCRLALATEASQPVRIVSHLGRENLDRNAIAKQNVACQIDRTHSALAQQGFDLILAIEDRTHQRRGIVFQNLPVSRAEAHIIFKLCFAKGAVFHADLNPKRYINNEVLARSWPSASYSLRPS